jgi:hypothetical protein
MNPVGKRPGASAPLRGLVQSDEIRSGDGDFVCPGVRAADEGARNREKERRPVGRLNHRCQFGAEVDVAGHHRDGRPAVVSARLGNQPAPTAQASAATTTILVNR